MKKYYILNIPFVNESYSKLIKNLREGGLLVVPSGPGLATLDFDKKYTEAVQNSDYALPDSGYMVFLLRIIKCVKIKKFSGYKFLTLFLNNENFLKHDIFLVNPNQKETNLNYNYLNKIGIPLLSSYQYISPIYNKESVEDKNLVETLNKLDHKPKYIIINLGSGIQEPLGYYLKKKLNYKPTIICTGAAIAFLTGAQANINKYIDKFGLGWLWRCIKYPKIFIPRYMRAFSLIGLIFKTKIEVTK
tara:strand:- start:7007 stop:7744 length:738 start_codon:yes stop_codon:yes gene_type:complete